MWRKPPQRRLPASLAQYASDVDRKTTPADRFFSEITRKALFLGVQFVLVDTPPGSAQTRQEAGALGIRPYFVQVSPLDVIDWAFETDEAGVEGLKYVVIRERVERSAVPFQGHAWVQQWRLWTKNSFEIWQEQDNQPVLVSAGDNPLGLVPLVPFYYEEQEPMVGASLLADVASLCLALYRKENERDISEFYTAVPFYHFKGFSEEELQKIAIGSANGIISNNPEAEIVIVEAAGTAIEAIRQSANDLHEAILEIAMRMVRPETRAAESFEKAQLDRLHLNTQLEYFSRKTAVAEKRCWELAALWQGDDPANIEIEYNTDFDIQEQQGETLFKGFPPEPPS